MSRRQSRRGESEREVDTREARQEQAPSSAEGSGSRECTQLNGQRETAAGVKRKKGGIDMVRVDDTMDAEVASNGGEVNDDLGSKDKSKNGIAKRAKKVVEGLSAVFDNGVSRNMEDVIVENMVCVRRYVKYVLDMCKMETHLDIVAESGAVELVIRVMRVINKNPVERQTVQGFEELERDVGFVLGLMAIKVEHQQAICDAGALPTLVGIVRRYSEFDRSELIGLSAQTCRRASDAITNLAHENNGVKNMVREEDGVRPLVYLLESNDPKVQRAVAGTLRTLAFKNEENKDLIVHLNALPLLVQMLRSDDSSIHYEAVGVIGNLVHSSQHIKIKVLNEGALQPVIDLLSSPCPDSQREAALLLGQFATVESDFKCRIAQRGAVPPLISMLSNRDCQLKEMAAFALGRLAQNKDNQAGIVAMGGLKPLLSLLDSDQPNLQHNAAFALYGLSENEDNLIHFIRDGAIQIIQECDLGPQASRDCVQKMTRRLQDKLTGDVLPQLLYVFKGSQRERGTIAINLGLLLCAIEPPLPGPISVTSKLVKKGVHKALADIVCEVSVPEDKHVLASRALANVAHYSGITVPRQINGIQPPEPDVFLGEQYLNKKALSDVIFLVEGKEFYAHKIALQAGSEVFKSMFEGDYKEKEADSIPIPNIRWPVFEAMMRCLYTGTVEVKPDIAQELLEAADQYMIENLKSLCQVAITEELTSENVSAAFDLAEAYDAPELATACVVFCLEGYAAALYENRRSYNKLIQRMTKRLVQLLESYVEDRLESQDTSEDDDLELMQD
ncbi:hypothetical protein M9435_006032 [Picochlorum sp. BPE23]|nr:hypothetical protein M9435_006032 [Picochlorum sp. BPE23]